MNIPKNILAIIVLQFIPLLLYPPAMLISGWAAALVVVVVFAILGFFLAKGKLWALSMSILLQGLNIVVRIMMLFPNSIRIGVWNVPYLVTSLAAIVLSVWFLLRLDKPDIRALTE